jgi:hypothetical protein
MNGSEKDFEGDQIEHQPRRRSTVVGDVMVDNPLQVGAKDLLHMLTSALLPRQCSS